MPTLGKRLRTVLSRLYVGVLMRRRGLEIGPNVFVKGWPYIRIVSGGSVKIGSNVVLNSSNRKYHVNMFAPVKLIADGHAAELIVGKNSRIHGSCLHARGKITIGANCLIAANCQIIDNSGHLGLMESPEERLTTRGEIKDVTIEDNVWIGMNSIVLPGAVIRRGAVIAAGSIVAGEIPENSLYGNRRGEILKRQSSDPKF